jgi:hypothetical protein
LHTFNDVKERTFIQTLKNICQENIWIQFQSYLLSVN